MDQDQGNTTTTACDHEVDWLVAGAGAAGMIKTLLALHNKTLPPSLNFERPPANSPLVQSPFRVQTQPEPWAKKAGDGPRRAAVSAFGFGGINGHVLLEEWSEKSADTAAFSLSSDDEKIPDQKAGRYISGIFGNNWWQIYLPHRP